MLEVGSYDVNGSVRPIFDATTYTGIDMRPGPGVDRVATSHDLPFPADTFDVVSTEVLDHDLAFWQSMAEMGRVLRPGGWLLLTARGNGFPEHDHPDDLWRFMPSSFPWLLQLAGCDPVEVTTDPQAPGMFGAGQRRAPGRQFFAD